MKQVNEKNVDDFPVLKTRYVAQESSDKYIYKFMALQQEFIRRFADFKPVERLFDFLNSHLACDLEGTPEELQLKLIHLQADNSIKTAFEGKPLIEFYNSLHSKVYKS